MFKQRSILETIHTQQPQHNNNYQFRICYLIYFNKNKRTKKPIFEHKTFDRLPILVVLPPFRSFVILERFVPCSQSTLQCPLYNSIHSQPSSFEMICSHCITLMCKPIVLLVILNAVIANHSSQRLRLSTLIETDKNRDKFRLDIKKGIVCSIQNFFFNDND